MLPRELLAIREKSGWRTPEDVSSRRTLLPQRGIFIRHAVPLAAESPSRLAEFSRLALDSFRASQMPATEGVGHGRRCPLIWQSCPETPQFRMHRRGDSRRALDVKIVAACD